MTHDSSVKEEHATPAVPFAVDKLRTSVSRYLGTSFVLAASDTNTNIDAYVTPLTRLGYAHIVVGAHYHPDVALHLHQLAIVYILCDCVRHARVAHKATAAVWPALLAAVDALAWQLLATVWLAGLCFGAIVRLAGTALAGLGRPTGAGDWAPTVAGVAALPLVSATIDWFAERMMERTFRRVLG